MRAANSFRHLGRQAPSSKIPEKLQETIVSLKPEVFLGNTKQKLKSVSKFCHLQHAGQKSWQQLGNPAGLNTVMNILLLSNIILFPLPQYQS